MHRIAATFAMFAFAQLVWAAPFQNGSFEAGFPITSPEPCLVTLPAGSTNLTGWTVIRGNIDWFAPACGVQSATNGIANVDLVGNQMVGGIQQTFDTEPGYVYEVRFDLNGNFSGPPVVKPLTVTVAGVVQNFTFDTTGENAGNAASFWSTQFFTFVASGDSETITFVSDTTGQGVNAGAIIDNVRITSGSGLTPPSIVKSFGAATVPLNGSTSLTFTISNPNDVFLNGVGFTDTLPQGLVVSAPNGLTGSCDNGNIVAAPGSGNVSLTGAALSGAASCTFSVNVTGTTPGTKNNTVTVTSTNAGTGNTASASVTVVPGAAPPTIQKSFGAVTMAVSESTSLSFAISNPNPSNALTGVGFTDALPQGLVVSTPNGLTGSCGGGTIVASAGSGSLSLTGATLAANASCTFSVNVTATSPGTKNNTTSSVSSVEGGPGGTASSMVTVTPPRCAAPTITSGSPPSGTVGVPYAFSVTASGDPPLTLSVSGLPARLTFNPATGSISGVPTAAGTSTLTITASNGCQPSAVQTQTLTVARSASTLSISASPNPAYFGQAVIVIVRAAGGPFPPQGIVLLCAREENAFCPPPFDTAPPGTPASRTRALLSAPLDASGRASFTLSGLSIDNYVLKASYGRDAAHDGASAGPIDEFVIKGTLLAPPNVSLGTPLRATIDAPLFIGVRVTPSEPAPMPTGTVQLYASTALIGSAPLDANGSTQFRIAAAATGTLALHAEYSGDALFPSAASPERLVTIAAGPAAEIPAVGPIGLALLALALAVLGMRPLYRRTRRL